jgi:uncharacterized protein YcbK (DUF882 family)
MMKTYFAKGYWGNEIVYQRGASMGNLSAHFSQEEFVCHCCGTFRLDDGLLAALELLRERSGQAVHVLSGYRCPKHNRRVGGASDSQHVLGRAADIRIHGLTLQQMYDLAESVADFARGGIGVYDRGFLHVDVRGHRARWSQVAGKYVGVEQLVCEKKPEAARATGQGH